MISVSPRAQWLSNNMHIVAQKRTFVFSLYLLLCNRRGRSLVAEHLVANQIVGVRFSPPAFCSINDKTGDK